jgi:hypothetical protein
MFSLSNSVLLQFRFRDSSVLWRIFPAVINKHNKRNETMPQTRFNTINTSAQIALWKPSIRVWHWLTAASLVGATTLTSQGDIGHAALGLIALGILLIQLIAISKSNAHSPALWLVTAVTVVLDLSGWLAPYSTFHMGATMAALVLASLYCATVLFESLQYINVHADI